jgi:RimJ/RimL family protein N-acetyltransferase
MQEAIDLSLDSLRLWMPWAKNEPNDFKTKIVVIQKMRDNFDQGIDFVYGIFTKDEDQVIGSYGLEILNDDLMEIGCWISSKYQGRGYSTETTRAVIKTVFEVCRIDNVQISFNKRNVSSLRVAQKAGFRIRRSPIQTKAPTNADMIVSVLSQAEYLQLEAKDEPVACYDSMGRRIDLLLE